MRSSLDPKVKEVECGRRYGWLFGGSSGGDSVRLCLAHGPAPSPLHRESSVEVDKGSEYGLGSVGPGTSLYFPGFFEELAVGRL